MISEYVLPAIRSNTEIFGLLTFFVGLGAGHWLNLGRDKRQEFNEAALPIRNWLLGEIQRPSAYTQRPSIIEIDQFTQRLSLFRRNGFRVAYEQQQEARERFNQRDSFGGVSYSDDAHIIKALKKCLGYTNLK